MRYVVEIIEQTIRVDADEEGVWISWSQSEDDAPIRMEVSLFADYVEAHEPGPVKDVLMATLPMVPAAAIQMKAQYAERKTYESAVTPETEARKLLESYEPRLYEKLQGVYNTLDTIANDVIAEGGVEPTPGLTSAMMHELFKMAMRG